MTFERCFEYNHQTIFRPQWVLIRRKSTKSVTQSLFGVFYSSSTPRLHLLLFSFEIVAPASLFCLNIHSMLANFPKRFATGRTSDLIAQLMV